MRRLLFILLLCLFPFVGLADSRIHSPVIASVEHTGSMIPYYMGGEVLLIWPRSINRVHINQVVLYWDHRRHLNVLHRVVMLVKTELGTWMLCKGDNNPVADYYLVPGIDLIGVATVQLWPIRL